MRDRVRQSLSTTDITTLKSAEEVLRRMGRTIFWVGEYSTVERTTRYAGIPPSVCKDLETVVGEDNVLSMDEIMGQTDSRQ